MKSIRIKRKILITSFLLSIFLLFSYITTNPVKSTYAESNVPSIQKVIDESVFIAFKKVESEKRLNACYLVPKGYYLPDIYTYGVFIAPQTYIEKYIKNGDYINELKEQGQMYVDVPATNTIEYSIGTAMNCGMYGMGGSTVDWEFVYALYCKDKDGNYAYSDLEKQVYSTSTATNITKEEEEKLAQQRLLDSKLEKIEEKTENLSNSLFVYFILGASAVTIIWGVYIGIKIVVAKNKEEKIDSRGMVKRFVIGIVILFVLALACPLLIKGLGAWVE